MLNAGATGAAGRSCGTAVAAGAVDNFTIIPVISPWWQFTKPFIDGNTALNVLHGYQPFEVYNWWLEHSEATILFTCTQKPLVDLEDLTWLWQNLRNIWKWTMGGPKWTSNRWMHQTENSTIQQQYLLWMTNDLSGFSSESPWMTSAKLVNCESQQSLYSKLLKSDKLILE